MEYQYRFSDDLMILSSLLVRNFRVIDEAAFSLQPGIQLFLGQNAQGKTSLIESILFLSTSTSHRTHREEELIRWGEKVAFLRGVVEQNERYTIECGIEKNRKSIKIDGVALPRVGDLYGRLRTVLFAPEDLSIIGGSPQERRRFIDMTIAQLDPQYIHLLHQFRHALHQRNHLLKQIQIRHSPTVEKELDIWNRPFLDFAAQVIGRRADTIKQLSPFVQEHYDGLADDGPMTISYPFSMEGNPVEIRQSLSERLQRLRSSEIDRGSSQVGPHRDDLSLILAGKSLTQYGSQGQRRTAALALRLAQARLCREWVGHWPLLLIDDVIHEMDNHRRTRFWQRIDSSGQIIATATDREYLGSGIEPVRIFKVKNGSISSD